jgi:hypothetical protein
MLFWFARFCHLGLMRLFEAWTQSMLERFAQWVRGRSKGGGAREPQDQVEVAALSEFCFPFVTLHDIPQPGRTMDVSGLDSQIRSLRKKIDRHGRTSPERFPRPPGLKCADDLFAEAAIHLSNRKQKRLHALNGQLLVDAVQYCEEMKKLCRSVRSNPHFVVNVPGFLERVTEWVRGSTELDRLQRRVRCLRTRLPSGLPPSVTASDVKAVLQRVIPEFDTTMNYMPNSEFDFAFRRYVERYYGELYRQITDAIGLFEYAGALRMLQAAA